MPRYTYFTGQGSTAPTGGFIAASSSGLSLGFTFTVSIPSRVIGFRVYTQSGEKPVHVFSLWDDDFITMIASGMSTVRVSNTPQIADGWVNHYVRPQLKLLAAHKYLLWVSLWGATKTTANGLSSDVVSGPITIRGGSTLATGGWFNDPAQPQNPNSLAVNQNLFGVDIILTDL